MVKQVTIVGIGLGNRDTMTIEALQAVEQCDCLIGAARLLDGFEAMKMPKYAAVLPEKIRQLIDEQTPQSRVAVVVSGDVGFFSGTKKLLEALAGLSVRLIPGVSSLVYFCSQLQIPWEDVAVLSVHGRESRILGKIMTAKRTFLLTGNTQKVEDICAFLTAQGLGQLQVTAGERLSYPEQRIVSGSAEELSQMTFADLSVMLVENQAPLTPGRQGMGLADGAFIRGEVPMTKSEVRCVAISKLRLQPGDIVYDIGAGTGSVAVEIALQDTDGYVYALEKKAAALDLIAQNKAKFAVHNLKIVDAEAPDGLAGLPAPDAVFIGGSSGQLRAIIQAVLAKNPLVRLVINAIVLETVAEALDCLQNQVNAPEIIQLTVAGNKQTSAGNMMLGQNPVFIISGQGGMRG